MELNSGTRSAMLKLYQFPRRSNSISHSPYCAKLETYLKIAQIPYENIATLDFSKNPKKQMPFIELNGKIIADSSFIIENLITEYGDKVDYWLNDEQKAISVALQRLLENHLFPILMYFRWVYPDGWRQFKEVLFAKAPFIVKLLIANKISKKIARRLANDQAIRNFTVEEMLRRAKVDLDALSNCLGDKSYLFGDKISSIDAILFGVYGGIALININTPLSGLAGGYANLKRHSELILKSYYSN